MSDIPVERWGTAGDRLLILEQRDFGAPWNLWAGDGSPGSEHLVQELPIRFAFPFLPFRSGMLLVAERLDGAFGVYFGNEAGLEPILDVGSDDEPGSPHAVAGANVAYLVLRSCRLFRTDGTAEGDPMSGTFELDPAATGLEGGGCGSEIGIVGERLFFSRETDPTGTELWTSDGTPAGTVLLKDLHAGADPSRLTRWTAGDELLYFLARGPGRPAALWRSDGTAAGTQEVRAFLEIDDLRDRPLGLLDGRAVFAAAANPDAGLEVWSSDGTAAGTGLLANLSPDVASSNPGSLFGSPSDIVFKTEHRTSEDGERREIWRVDDQGDATSLFVTEAFLFLLARTDRRVFVETSFSRGTAPTQVLTIDLETGETTTPLEVGNVVFESELVGEQLFFISGFFQGSSGRQIRHALWVTDGTEAGAARLFEHEELDGLRSFPADLQGFRGELFFENDPSDGFGSSSFLWRSDGTRQGTGQARNVRPGGTLPFPDLLAASDDRLYLHAEIEAGTLSLLALDPTLRIVRRLDLTEGLPPFFSAPVVFQDGLVGVTRPDFFSPITEVWRSDVTPGGTLKLDTFDSVGALLVSGDRIFFPAATPEHGTELWVSDGTAVGTRLVRDLEPGPASSAPSSLQVVGGSLIFSARTASTGVEAWVSDGTAEGTRLLADVNPGPASSNPAEFTLLGERVYFSATRSDVGRELFAVDRASVNLPCVPGESTLCLNGDRFAVRVDWADFLGATGSGHAVPLTANTGYFWFFSADNVEAVVKVLDGCAINSRVWVFAAGLTNVGVALTVTDTETGEVKIYRNVLGAPFAPVQDTMAFDSCPAKSLRPGTFR